MDNTKRIAQALMGWQSIGARGDGRNIIRSPAGEVMTEYQKTAPAPNGMGWVNFPSIFGGVEPLGEDDAYNIMLRNGWVDPDTGQNTYQQTFPTVEAAERAAALRSSKLLKR